MAKKPTRRSMASAFSAMNEESAKEQDKQPKKNAPRSLAGSSIVQQSKRSLDDLLKERDYYKVLSENAGTTEINPALIDPSPFADRMADDSDQEFAAFKQSIADDGLKVPVQLRIHPDDPTRYQTIYGHRRVRALKELDHPVKALIVDYNDTELLLAQGIENSQRQNLSWIEKALFAHELETQGVKSGECQKALGVDKVAMSNFRKVVKALSPDLIKMIGRAPSIGRPRWIELVEHKPDLNDIQKRLSADNLLSLSSDERFHALLASFSKKSNSKPAKKNEAETWEFGDLGKVKATNKKLEFALTGHEPEKFIAFMKSELPTLLKRFQSQKK